MELLPATRLAPSAPKPFAPGTGRAPRPAPGAGGRSTGGGKAAIAALLASRLRRRELRSARRAAEPAAAPFEICEVPGKGLGAVASRDVKVGELVAEERPPITYVEKSGWVEDMEKQFAALPADTQNALMALHDTEEEKSLKGIFNTNSIGCYSSALDGVLCVVISRFNHSCLPNCEQSWDDDLFRQRLFACKDIKKGEELCFSYVEPFLSFAERSEILEKRYVFRCDCPACTRSGEALRQSDARRRRLGQLVSQLSQGASADAEGGVALAEELLQSCEEEGLTVQGFRAQACYHAFQCLLRARQVDEALPWLRQARQQLQLSRGPEDPDVRTLRGYEEDPLSHPAASDEGDQFSALALPAGLAAAAAALYLLKGQ